MDDFFWHEPASEEKYQARRTNFQQAKEMGFNDLSPSGFYGTDTGEHVAVCERCSSLVHYPLPLGDDWWSPTPKYVKGTDSLRKHLNSVHGIEETTDERVHREDPAQR